MEGNGLYQEIIKAVYPEYSIEFIYASYARSKKLVEAMHADLWIGAYHDEEPYALYPSKPFDLDDVSAMFLPRNKHLWSETSSLEGANVAWMKDYDYQTYFPELQMNFYELQDASSIFKLLETDRVQFLIGDHTEWRDAFSKIGQSINNLEVETFAYLGLYPAFADNELGEKLNNQWDERIAQLIASGKIKKLYEKHQVVSEYKLENNVPIVK